VVKLYNASKYVLAQSGPEAPVTCDLDLSFLERLRETALRATAALDAFDYASALDLSERFFWSGFTDTYVELAKARARSESDPAGRGSAVAALQLGLKTLLRLFAPFVPYITEEIWSWGFGREPGAAPSVHRAPWPGAADFAGLPEVEGGGAVFATACALLEAVNRAKAAQGATVGRHVARLRVAANAATLARLTRVQGDALSAARVLAHETETRADLDDDVFEVPALELAPPPAQEPRA
jgi:valyl-tRNA synthetase